MTRAGARHSIASHPGRPAPLGGEAGEFVAWLDEVSLTLTISHTRKELDAGLGALTPDRPLNDISRTYVHELAHSTQALGTTLGYFTWMLRSAQSDYVLRMLRWLVQDAKRPVRMQLIRYLPTLDAYDRKATGLVHGWLITEGCVFLRGVSLRGVSVMRRARGRGCFPGRSGSGASRCGSGSCSSSCSCRGLR